MDSLDLFLIFKLWPKYIWKHVTAEKWPCQPLVVKPCNGHSFYPNDRKLSFVFLYCNFLLIISQYIHQYQYICHKLISTNKSAWLIPDLRSNCGQYNIIITKTNNSQRYRNKTQFVIQTNYPLKKRVGKFYNYVVGYKSH